MIKVEGAAKIKVSKSKTSIPVLPKGRRAQEGQKTTYNILWLVLKAVLSKYHKIDESNSKTTSQGRQGIVERKRWSTNVGFAGHKKNGKDFGLSARDKQRF